MALTYVDLAFLADGTGGPVVGSKNKIINGGMAVDQRNAGAAQTFTAAAALAYSVDRWYGYSTGANVTGQRVAGSNNTQYRYRFTGAASTTAIGFGQRIEAVNCYDLAGKTATLSLDLANSLLTSVTWTAYYASTTDTFGTLASPTRTQIATGTFTVTSTVTRYSTQISVPSAATTGIEIVFTVGAQISGTWTIGNVQLESGVGATPFERRSYGQELALCQRYYEKSYSIGKPPGDTTDGITSGANFLAVDTASALGTATFKVSKRAIPTVTVYSPTTGVVNNVRDSVGGGNVAVSGVNDITENGFFRLTSTWTTGRTYSAQYVASSEL